MASPLSESFAALYERIVVAGERAAGERLPRNTVVTAAQLRVAAANRPLLLDPTVSAFYEGVGEGTLAWMDVVDIDDRFNVGNDIAYDQSLFSDERDFPDGLRWGDLPSDSRLAVTVSNPCHWSFDAGNGGRIVAFWAGYTDGLKSWVTAPSLLAFVECVADLVEEGPLEITHRADGTPKIRLVGDWDPERYRRILDRHGSNGSVYAQLDML